MSDQQQPIIIKRIKKSAEGGHSSAWKVAYADFMSAMLALFIVLWILGQSDAVKQAVAAYFIDPIAFKAQQASPGALNGEPSVLAGTPKIERKIIPPEEKPPSDLEKRSEEARETLENALQSLPLAEKFKDQIKVEIIKTQNPGETEHVGVRVQFQDRENKEFFKTGSETPTPEFVELLQAMTRELTNIPSSIVVEGYADSRPYTNRTNYSNWNLSFDRANSVRKIMVDQGLDTNRMAEIRGYGDRQLADPAHPESPRNRRVSVVLLMK